MSKKWLQIAVFASLSSPFLGGNLMAMDADQQRMCILKCSEDVEHCVDNCKYDSSADTKEGYLACVYACDDTEVVCIANCKR